jgi:hypothetical protein
MQASGYKLNSKRHRVCRTRFQDFLEREPLIAKTHQKLVSVWDKHRKQYSVGIWTSEIQGRYLALATWTPDKPPNRDARLTVIFNLDPSRRERHIKEWLQRMEDEETSSEREDEEWRRASLDARDYMISKLPVGQRDNPALKAMPVGPM